MKLKKKMGALVCCLAVAISMFSVNALPAQAAQCTHPHFLLVPDACHDIYSTIDGHYEMRGTEYICPNCNYTYWKDLHGVKVGDHTWVHSQNANKDGWDYYCAGCGHYKSDF